MFGFGQQCLAHGYSTPRDFRAYLELDVLRVLLDLHALGVLPARLQQEVLDLLDLAGHLEERCESRTVQQKS